MTTLKETFAMNTLLQWIFQTRVFESDVPSEEKAMKAAMLLAEKASHNGASMFSPEMVRREWTRRKPEIRITGTVLGLLLPMLLSGQDKAMLNTQAAGTATSTLVRWDEDRPLSVWVTATYQGGLFLPSHLRPAEGRGWALMLPVLSRAADGRVLSLPSPIYQQALEYSMPARSFGSEPQSSTEPKPSVTITIKVAR